MGEDIINPLDLEPGKWYCVTTELWRPTGPPWRCNDFHAATLNCCDTGQAIINWIENNWTCTLGFNFCPGAPNECQRIIEVKGPYDTFWACDGDCP